MSKQTDKEKVKKTVLAAFPPLRECEDRRIENDHYGARDLAEAVMTAAEKGEPTTFSYIRGTVASSLNSRCRETLAAAVHTLSNGKLKIEISLPPYDPDAPRWAAEIAAISLLETPETTKKTR